MSREEVSPLDTSGNNSLRHYESYRQQSRQKERRETLRDATVMLGSFAVLAGGVTGLWMWGTNGESHPPAPCEPPTPAGHAVVEQALHQPLPKPFRKLAMVFEANGGDLPKFDEEAFPNDFKVMSEANVSIKGLHWVTKKTYKKYEAAINATTNNQQLINTLSNFGTKELGIQFVPVTKEIVENQGYTRIYPFEPPKNEREHLDFLWNARKELLSFTQLPKEYFQAAHRKIYIAGKIWDGADGIWATGLTDDEKITIGLGEISDTGGAYQDSTQIHETAHGLQPECEGGRDFIYIDKNPDGFSYTNDKVHTPVASNQAGVVVDGYSATTQNEDEATSLTDLAQEHTLEKSGPLRAKKELWLDRLAARYPQLARFMIFSARAKQGDFKGRYYPSLPGPVATPTAK